MSFASVFWEAIFYPMYFPGVAAALLFGLFAGKLINTIVSRLPKMMFRDQDNFVAMESGRDLPHNDRFELFFPFGGCEHCGTKGGWLGYLPIVGSLSSISSCDVCKKTKSRRHFLVEAITGLISGMIAWQFGLGFLGLSILLFAYFLIALAAIDMETRLLPDALTMPFLWIGLLMNLFGAFATLEDAVVGAAGGYLILWTVYWAHRICTKNDGMGYGDFKLLAALGAWLGWAALPYIVAISASLGVVAGIANMAIRRRSRKEPLPFGPFLAIGGLLVMTHGGTLNTLIFDLLN